MSKIGKNPIQIPDKINIQIEDDVVKVSDGKDSLEIKRLDGVEMEEKDGELVFSIKEESKQIKSNWGTQRALVQNAIKGLTEGFEKHLVLKGVGYRITKEGKDLSLALGFSHPIKYKKPDGIEFEVEDKDKLTIKGKDKALVGQVAAEIKKFRPVEPYKGKGFRYKGEEVRRKVGKKATGEGVGAE